MVERGHVNMTDEDTRILKGRGRYIQGYNAQVSVGENDVIIGIEVTGEANDIRELGRCVERVEELKSEFRAKGESVHVADRGYANLKEIRRCRERGWDVRVPWNKKKLPDFKRERIESEGGKYVYVEERDGRVKRCYGRKRGDTYEFYEVKGTSIKVYRTVDARVVEEYASWEAYAEEVQRARENGCFKERLAREHVMASLKQRLVGGRIQRRGREGAQIEHTLSAIAHNIVRYVRLMKTGMGQRMRPRTRGEPFLMSMRWVYQT